MLTPVLLRRLLLLALALLPGLAQAQPAATARYQPAEDLGALFADVQLSGLFPDSKTFVDARPLMAPDSIVARYSVQQDTPDFDLRAFVERHFEIPEPIAVSFETDEEASMEEHLRRLWPYLTRAPDTARTRSSLIPLPEPYVVPGGRFREIYYWDSYFTLLGLAESDRMDLARSMVANFAHLIETQGFIPNGNRTYYLTRSQPPFFASMVGLLAREDGDEAALAYLDALRAEYDFWMRGERALAGPGDAVEHVVQLDSSAVLNRYWDRGAAPRPESYREDYELAQGHPPDSQEALYRNLRSAAESGWDFSSRWLADGQSLATTITTDIIPVDLNALLYAAEEALSRLYGLRGDAEEAGRFAYRAARRRAALLRYTWDEEDGFFYDYNFQTDERTGIVSLAAVYPLYFGLATPEQARRVAEKVEADLLKPGGFVTTTRETGQQWDAPNGWAPLQWLTIQGLRRYGLDGLADEGERRWLRLNRAVYERTGKMTEKYNVVNLDLEGGGGEYPLQDGFGWTNGVALGLLEDRAAPR